MAATHPHQLLRFSPPLADQRGCRDVEESGLTLRGNCLGKQCLSCPCDDATSGTSPDYACIPLCRRMLESAFSTRTAALSKLLALKMLERVKTWAALLVILAITFLSNILQSCNPTWWSKK